MKRLLLFILLLPLAVTAQTSFPIDSTSGKIRYTEVVEVKNSQKALFKNAQTWVTQTFKNYKSVVQLDDAANGKLILKGISNVGDYINEYVSYTLQIDCKDNKYRYIISDLVTNDRRFGPTGFPLEFMSKMEIEAESDKKKLDEAIQAETRKSELRKLEKKKAEDLDRQNRNTVLNRSVHKEISSLVESLKKTMKIEDDF